MNDDRQTRVGLNQRPCNIYYLWFIFLWLELKSENTPACIGGEVYWARRAVAAGSRLPCHISASKLIFSSISY